MPKVGDILDRRYRLSRLLGVGGMGSVYAAEHVILGKQVAIKILHAHHVKEQDVVERLYREAKAATAIGHRGIAEVHDVGWTEDGTPYLAMDLLEGQSLADRLLEEGGTLAIDEGVDVVAQMLEVLGAVHDKGIVHRDLKPENIFLCREETGVRSVKVLDFGVAKVTIEQAAGNLTRTGTVVGTPYYMAPEQALGKRDLDNRVDIWQAGAILYLVVVGRVPYEGESYNEVLAQIILRPVTPPRTHDAAIPEALEAIILKALARDLDERYAGAEEFLAALQAFRESYDVTTEVDTGPPDVEEADKTEETSMEAVAGLMAEPDPTPEPEEEPSADGAAPDDSEPDGKSTTQILAQGMRRDARTRYAGIAVAVAALIFAIWAGARYSRGGRQAPPVAVEQAGPAPLGAVDAHGGGAGSDRVAGGSTKRDGGSLLVAADPEDDSRDAPRPAKVRRPRPHALPPAEGDQEEEGEPSATGDAGPGLTRREVGRTLQKLRPYFRMCLQQSSVPLSALDLRIEVGGDGVAAYRGASPTPPETVVFCVRRVLRQARFRAAGGETISILYRVSAPEHDR